MAAPSRPTHRARRDRRGPATRPPGATPPRRAGSAAPAGQATRPRGGRRPQMMGRHGSIAAVSAAWDRPASRAYSDCMAALMARGRSGSSTSSGTISDRRKWLTARSRAAGARTSTDPVDEFRTIRRHDHVAGVKIAMAQPVPRRQAVDQGEDASRRCAAESCHRSSATSGPSSRAGRDRGGGGVL